MRPPPVAAGGAVTPSPGSRRSGGSTPPVTATTCARRIPTATIFLRDPDRRCPAGRHVDGDGGPRRMSARRRPGSGPVESRAARLEACHRDAERRAIDVVEPHVVEEVHRPWVSAMLPAHTDV